MVGSVLSGVGGFYTVLTDDGQRFTLRAQAKLRRQRMTPMTGFPSCGARGLVALRHVGSSWTRDHTCVSCIDKWILYP